MTSIEKLLPVSGSLRRPRPARLVRRRGQPQSDRRPLRSGRHRDPWPVCLVVSRLTETSLQAVLVSHGITPVVLPLPDLGHQVTRRRPPVSGGPLFRGGLSVGWSLASGMLVRGDPFVAHEQAAPSIAASVLSLVDVDRTVLDVAGYPPPEGGKGLEEANKIQIQMTLMVVGGHAATSISESYGSPLLWTFSLDSHRHFLSVLSSLFFCFQPGCQFA